MSNLRLINETSISSSVSSFSVTDVFTSDFDIYKITATGLSTTGTDYTEVDFRFITGSGSVVSTSNYHYGGLHMLNWTGFTDLYSTSQSKIRRCFAESTDQAPETASSNLWVFNPAVAGSYSQVLYQNTGYYGGSYGSSMTGFGILQKLGTYTGFNVFENNGSRPLASGTFRTYGLRVDT